MNFHEPIWDWAFFLVMIAAIACGPFAWRHDKKTKNDAGPLTIVCVVVALICFFSLAFTFFKDDPADIRRAEAAEKAEEKAAKAKIDAWRIDIEKRYDVTVIKWDQSPSWDGDDTDLYYLNADGRLCTATWLENDQDERTGLNPDTFAILDEIKCDKAPTPAATKEGS